MTTELVVLLDESGEAIGTTPKATVHTRETPLHLAFSCHVLDDEGRVLVTRRALSKLTWPGVWTNSFCGHPGPGEDTEDAIRRRARDELGMEVVDIALVDPHFRYRAVDASGIVENEICPIYTARPAPGSVPQPHPDEVMDHAWVEPRHLRAAIEAVPFALSPWLVLSAPSLSLLGGAEA
ncbi:isopentenyl-diphosphate Delta-isomerase [Actinotalea sp.]|uniref:isopentenyl-diphosphate Delta-isomerase n=1 Tax=Actinotalea sp. TaxID=1872145 RepID=UPI00356324D3